MAIADKELREGGALRLERFFTTAGVDPYDEVEWDTRDAVIGFGDKIAFEQRGIEFPKSWSQNSTNIVAQKYFRGPLDTPRRERSVRQMIGRVVGWYKQRGSDDGYLVSDEAVSAFRDELTHLLLQQKMAFNSPVWFNVGLVEPPRVSACQPYYARVITPAGPIPIGQLVEQNALGTKILDAHGITRIEAVKHNGMKEVIRVDVGSHQLDVTADHLVWRTSQGDGTGRFVPAGELKVGDRLVWVRTSTEGEGSFDSRDLAEAGIAGWLQTDGFVGRYTGTNKSWTIEFQTVTDSEFEWVNSLLDEVFPDIHRKVRHVVVQDERLTYRRIRLYGRALQPFIEKWALMRRGVDAEVPPALFTAPLPVVRHYLRSVFQAEGYVGINRVNGNGDPYNGSRIGAATISPGLMKGVKILLERFGIFSRLTHKVEKRPDRKDIWDVGIGNLGDQIRFFHEIGFIDSRKQDALEGSFDRRSSTDRSFRTMLIRNIESLGDMDVYDIQTESGEYLSDGIRVHNCFILDVEDEMSSILNWYVEEGLIFKSGSGSGVNLSKLRSSKEQLSSGGSASGPVSFMRGADASAGTIKSGGSTRRAAKMVVLDVDHPDVEEFIWCKVKEERKARALREAGFDMDLDGEDSYSLQYQNANNSVGLSDEFLQTYIDDGEWDLKAVKDGRVMRTLRARDLMRQIAEAAWECADPGVFYLDTMNRWHTSPAEGPIRATNPCGEFLRPANTSCNLSSLRVTQFLGANDEFLIDDFIAAIDTTLTAMDISVSNAEYPTDKITKMANSYRELGLGYTDLGALLMRQGVAYDSDAGRAWAAAITALMGGAAYRRSAEIAAAVGPYPGWSEPGNADAHLDVVRRHQQAVEGIDASLAPRDIIEAARAEWERAITLGEQHGFRNAQVTLIAPTGTISFLLDADTTGIEPDLALVKTKKLVGGGVMKIVNQAVPAALKKLGYAPEEISEIIAYIAEENSVKGAPFVREEHYSIFDCAMGESPIHYMGHVKMMAAAQPFLSGAISKTVNMPEDASVEDIEHLYIEAWRLGLKNLAIYRDNCKVAQPLSATKKTPAAVPESATSTPVRRKLPRKRPAKTMSFRVADCDGYVLAGEYPDTGELGEIFLKVAKQGSTLAGVMDAFAIAISIGLQYGVPLRAYVDKFINMRFEPSGVTDDPDFRFATSIVDYIFRRLAADYLSAEEREALNIWTVEERQQSLDAAVQTNGNGHSKQVAETVEISDPPEIVTIKGVDAPMCYTCGIAMQPAGSCFVCNSCGTTSGCS